jgi:hypothetical protein
MRELRSHLGRHQPTRIDPEAEKRAGWCRHGILVVAEHDPRRPGPSARWCGSWAPGSTVIVWKTADEPAPRAL